MKKLFNLSVSIYLISLFFMGCGNKSAGDNDSSNTAGDSTGVSDTEIVIGTFGPLTGPAALWGNIPKGMDAYFKMLNDEGGVNGRKIKLIVKDDAYDPSRTVPAVRQMVQKDEIFAMVAGVGTAPCMSVMDYLLEEKVPFIAPSSGATNWSIPLKKTVFGFLPYYIDEAIIQTRYAVETLNNKKIGIIYQNDDVGKSALIGASSVLEEKGLDFVAEVSVEITDTDLSSHIAKLKDSGAEVVLLWALPRQAVITVTNAKVINYQPQWIASFILSDMTLMHQLTKGAWEGVVYGSFGTPPYDHDDPTIIKYKAALAKYYPDVRWGTFSYSGFIYGQPFVEALKNIDGTPTREKLINELEKLDMVMDGLPIKYSKTNHQANRSMRLLQCTGSENYKVVSDYIESDSDIEALAAKMH